MVVFDGAVKSKAVLWLLLWQLLLVPAREKVVRRSALQEEVLALNTQITVSLPRGQTKVFQYLDVENHQHDLSVTITPCSTTVRWSFVYRGLEQLDKQNGTEFEGEDYESDGMKTVTVEKANSGWYLLVFRPPETDARVGVYLSMDGGGPYELSVPQKPNLVLVPQKRQRIKVSWEQSLVNPQNTSYCLVVNTKKEQPTLCGAEEEGPTIRGSDVPVVVNLSNLRLEKKKKGKLKTERGMKAASNDTVIVCVGGKVQLTLTKVKRSVKYYFNLFAINNKTNMTIPYGKAVFRYNFTVRPMVLKDGVRKTVDLRKLEGKASFRFKVYSATKELHFYVLVCGGAVEVEISAKGLVKRKGRKAKESLDSLPQRTRVFGYKRFRIVHPAAGEQYYLKVSAANVDELTRIRYVEVFGTVYPGQRYPLPLLPDEPSLHEFKSQKKCDSVTIGWVPVYDASVNTYCVLVWENRRFNYADLFRGSFQCDLDEAPRRRSIFSSLRQSSVSTECEDMLPRKEKSVTHCNITNLKPGTSYTIQVTVKKKTGRTLSYKFLRVYTKYACGV